MKEGISWLIPRTLKHKHYERLHAHTSDNHLPSQSEVFALGLFHQWSEFTQALRSKTSKVSAPKTTSMISLLAARHVFQVILKQEFLSRIPSIKGSETLRSRPRAGKSRQQGLDPGGEQTLGSQTEEHSESWSSWTPGPMRRNGLGETWKNWLVIEAGWEVTISSRRISSFLMEMASLM